MAGIISLLILIFYLALGIHLWWSQVFEYLGAVSGTVWGELGDVALLEEICLL